MLKLADFGLGRTYRESALSGLTLAGANGGTPGYMAPEQVTDFHSARPTADQFSTAATLYYLLVGRTIYERQKTPIDDLLYIMKEEPVPLRQPAVGPPLPAGLGEVLRRAWPAIPGSASPTSWPCARPSAGPWIGLHRSEADFSDRSSETPTCHAARELSSLPDAV